MVGDKKINFLSGIKFTPVKSFRNLCNMLLELSDVIKKIGNLAIIQFMSATAELFTAFIANILALIAPLPSMFNIAHILADKYNYVDWQAWTVAIVLDLMAYGLTEKCVSWMLDDKVQKAKKIVGGILTTIYFLLLFGVVIGLEGFGVPVLFPALSLVASLFYGLVRHETKLKEEERNQQDSIVIRLQKQLDETNFEHERLNGTLNIVEHERDNLGVELVELRGELVQYTEKLRNNDIEREHMNIEHERISAELSIERERIQTLEHQLNTPVHTRVQHMSNGSSTTDERRGELLNILSNEYANTNVSDLNKTTLGQRLNTSHTTITRDLKFLEKKGMIHLNGVVEVIEQ